MTQVLVHGFFPSRNCPFQYQLCIPFSALVATILLSVESVPKYLR